MIFERNKDPKKVLDLGRPFGFGKNLDGIELNDGVKPLFLREKFALEVAEGAGLPQFKRLYPKDGFYGKYGRGGMTVYKCSIILKLRIIDGKSYYEVYGSSGDFGFNGGQRTQREYLGKRRAKSILRQYYEHLEEIFYSKKDFNEKAS